VTDETKTPETTDNTEKDFVLRVQLGLLFNFKATDSTVTEKMHELFEAFANGVKALDVAPVVLHVIDGDAMSKEDFNKMKANTMAHVQAVQEVLKMIQEKAGPDAAVEVNIGGQVLRADSEIVDLPSSLAEADAEQTVGGEAADAIEASPKAFRVGGSRTLN
jgi:hypothetical protein